MKRISNDETEKMEKVDQSGVYKIACGQCNSIYIGETGRKFSTLMKAKRDDRSLFGKHCNDEGHSSEALYAETSTRRKKLKEQLEIGRAKREGKQVLHKNTTKFESEKLLGLVVDGNKRNNLS